MSGGADRQWQQQHHQPAAVRGLRWRQFEQIVSAILKNRGMATYVLYPDEGHGFIRPENGIDFTARAEVFWGQLLGGRVEPMGSERMPGSTAFVRMIDSKL